MSVYNINVLVSISISNKFYLKKKKIDVLYILNLLIVLSFWKCFRKLIRILEIPVKSNRHKIFIHLYMVGGFLLTVYMFVYMYTQYTAIMPQIYTGQNPHILLSLLLHTYLDLCVDLSSCWAESFINYPCCCGPTNRPCNS